MSGKMRFISILAVLALFCGLAFGQAETGSVFGTVTDPQGAVVAGAKVTIKSSSTNAERSTTTNSNGLYTFTNLPPGPYKVTVEAANFSSTAKSLDVSVGSRNTVDFPLAVTGGSTTVEVTGEGGTVMRFERPAGWIDGERIPILWIKDRHGNRLLFYHLVSS